MSRSWRLLGAVVGAGLIAAACSSTPAPKHNTTTTTKVPVTVTTPGPPPTTSTTAAPATTTTASANACPGVTAVAGQSEGAAGTRTGSIILSDASATCTLNGYPRVLMFGAGNVALQVTMVDGLTVNLGGAANEPPAAVTLSPNGRVEFSYQFSDVTQDGETGPCPSSVTVSAIVPGNTIGTASFPLDIDPCANGTIKVSPVYAAS